MRVLVTGAAGFIGSSVTDALLARGDEVVGLDNFNSYYDPQIKEGNIAEVLQNPGADRFQLIRGDLTEESVLRPIFENESTRPDVICHLAAWAGVRPSIADPLCYVHCNVHGTTLMLNLCVEYGIKPFVFASSSSVYGARTKVPFSEDDRVDDPISPYAATKKAGELIGYTYHHLHQINFTGLRFFTVYGPRQRPEMAIHLFAQRILNGEPIKMFGDGSSSRDYTYIEDIVQGVIASIDRTAKTSGYRIYNLGCGRTTKLSELISTIEDAVGKKAIIERHGDQPGDVPTTYADVKLAQEELTYRPTTPPSEGIPKFVAWLKSRQA